MTGDIIIILILQHILWTPRWKKLKWHGLYITLLYVSRPQINCTINTWPSLCFLSHKAFFHLIFIYTFIRFFLVFAPENLICHLDMELSFKHQLGLVCVIMLFPALCFCQEYTKSRATFYGTSDGYGTPSTWASSSSYLSIFLDE